MSGFRQVLFDTSTLVSAALRVDSTPHKALAQALSRGEVCACASTLFELEQVLLRPKFDLYQPANVRSAFLTLVRKHVALFAVTAADESKVLPPCRDPKDNQLLALALACAADALVSSDADLLVLHPWRGIPIVTLAAFLLFTQ